MTKKLQPKLRFRGFTDAWEQRKLGRICRITMGQSPKGQNYTNDSNQYILVQGNADIVDRWVQPHVWTKEVTKTAEAGDLILSVRAPVGVVAKTAFPIVLGRGVAGIKGGEYIYQFLFMLEANNYWKSLSSGSTFDSITKEQLIDLPVHQPASEQERNRIGKLLHILDSILAAEKRKLDLLKKRKAALLQQIFDQKLRFKGYSNPWEQRKLGTIFVQANERNANQELSFEKTISVASMRFNPHGNGAAHSSLRTYKILRQGDIAFEGNRHRSHPFGQMVINDIGDGLMSSRFQSVRPKKPCVIPFWKYLLQNERSMRRLLICSTKAGTLMNEFVFDDFSKQDIPLPERGEQEKIGALFKLLGSILAAEKQRIELLDLKKKSLLQQMFV